MKNKNRTIPIILIAFFFVTFLCFYVEAQPIEYIEVKTIPLYDVFKIKEKWYVGAYQAENVETDYRTAKLCFWYDQEKKDQFCFNAEDDHVRKEEHYSYYLVKELKIVPLQRTRTPKLGILFVAENSAFTVGSVTFISLWSYNKEEEKFIKISPSIRITEQGEYKLISAMKGGVEGVLASADFIWGEEETRYAPHKYRIRIYKLEGDEGFKFIGEYVTRGKYKSLNDMDEINVISHELVNIQKFILNESKK